MKRKDMRTGRTVAQNVCIDEACGRPCHAITIGLVVLWVCVVEMWMGRGGVDRVEQERQEQGDGTEGESRVKGSTRGEKESAGEHQGQH